MSNRPLPPSLRILALCSILPLLVPARAAAQTPQHASAPWSVIVVGAQTEPERLATVDLQRYLGQVTGCIPQVIDAAKWQAGPAPAVMLGSPASNPVLARISVVKNELGQQGYVLANAEVAGTRVVVAAGQTGEGSVNAVYGLLRELGYGFFLGSESMPATLPARLPGDAPIVRNPAFAIRGVLPWYNFFNSPTAWDPIDHRAFIDQLIRSGANFVGFHTYDSEPFAACEEHGRMEKGARLVNTRNPTWGTHPMPAGDFAYGTGSLYADDYFGARSTQSDADSNAAIKLEQNIMRDALDYAKHRGLHTCIGFEVGGDPTDPAFRDVAIKRLNRLLDQYPAVDYLWIWQREAQGATGFLEHASDALHAYSAYRRNVFRRIIDTTAGARPLFRDTPDGKDARALEGVRLEQFAQLAHRILARRQNPPTLVVSGWGGDERILSAEYYDGLDKLLPHDVVFSSLDHILPRPRVDAIYKELPAGRQRWPIPWLEHDGDQWQPQPSVHVFEGLAKDALQGGCQGILGIHWRTRDVEENFAYLIDFAWQPGLTAEQFYAQMARRCYAPEIADKMAEIHSALDNLGYRWVGGDGQTECGRFSFGPGTAEKAGQLNALRAQALALLPKAGASSGRLKWLVAEMDWALKFRRAEITATQAQKLLDEGKAGDALDKLNTGDLADALRAYATRITTRGEYGVLATVNTKAVFAWSDLRNRCLQALGKPKETLTAPEWSPEPQILLPRLVASAPEHQDLELMPIALGGKPAWMHYRPIGGKDWKSLPLVDAKGWVRRVVLPAVDMTQPGVEIAFSFEPSTSGAQPAWGPAAVTVMPDTVVNKTPFPRSNSASAQELGLGYQSTKSFPFVLKWDELTDADYYKVYRDDALLAQTCVAYYADAPSKPAANHQYRVEAWGAGKILAQDAVAAKSPSVTTKDAVSPNTRWKKDGALVCWPPRSFQVACYQVLRSMPATPGKFEQLAELPAMRTGLNSINIPAIDGKSICRIIPVNQAGREMAHVDVELTWPNDETRQVVLSSLIEDAKPVGKVTVENGAATFDGTGYLECPHEPVMNFASGAALSFEFLAGSVEGMPVLLSHGTLLADGWFIQIIGRRLLIRTVGGDINGPLIEPGKWYALRWEYDGAKSDFYVNGKNVAPAQPLQMPPVDRPLTIGNYSMPGEQFGLRGSIRNVRFEGWLQKSDCTLGFDFTGEPPWFHRDGKVKLSTANTDGRPTIRLVIGGNGDSRFNSACIHQGVADLQLSPILNFRIRTSSLEPLAILFQQTKGNDDHYFALNLVGKHDAYHSLADLGSQQLNDGKWHQVSLDLKALVAQTGPGNHLKIKNLIVGSWQNPKQPVVVEFQDFSLGPQLKK